MVPIFDTPAQNSPPAESPCFAAGTLIETRRGEVPVEKLAKGDMVLTRDNGYQPIRWVGHRKLDAAILQSVPELNPIRIRAGALGHGLPLRDLIVSPQHRVMISNARTREWFAKDEVIAAAVHMTIFEGITQLSSANGVTYFHILFDRHELVLSDGAWTESFQPADRSLAALDHDQRREILSLFPELEDAAEHDGMPSVRPVIAAKALQGMEQG